MRNPVHQPAAAGRLADLRKLYARGAACIVVSFAALALMAVPASASFGIYRFATSTRNADGSVDAQAGSHPYAFTTTFLLNPPVENKGGILEPQGEVKDATVELPPGFVGDPTATPRCAYAEFATAHNGTGCPNDTVVGVATVYLTHRSSHKDHPYLLRSSNAVYNMQPPPGVAAEFAFVVKGEQTALLDVSVRTGGDYGLTVTSRNIAASAVILGAKVTIWGVPAAHSHDSVRGTCLSESEEVYEGVDGYTPPPGKEGRRA